MTQYDVAIIGGGMVGMSLAVALARNNFSVCVIEQTSMPDQLEPSFDGRVSAIALGSHYLLRNIGVWDALAPHAQPITDIRVSDGDMPLFLHYHHREVASEPFGFIAENRHIRVALQQAARNLPTLTIRDSANVLAIQQTQSDASVVLADETISAKLLIGADGKKSHVREWLDVKTTQWTYQQSAIVCTIEHSEPHQGLAQERFLPAGPFAVLPMTGNRSSLVWVEPTERISAYIDLPAEEFAQEIAERIGGYLGDITPTGARFTYPLSLMHAHSYYEGRVALIGDAAHAIHPIAGQGVNLGFRDVAVLAQLITETKGDIGAEALLAHYQRWRRFDNMTMMAVTDGLTRLFSNDILPIQLARGVGLWMVGKLPAAKSFFMRHAMGLEGKTPILLQAIKNQ